MHIALNLPAEVHWHGRALFTVLDAVPRRVVIAGLVVSAVVGGSLAAIAVKDVALAAVAAGTRVVVPVASAAPTVVAPDVAPDATLDAEATVEPVASPDTSVASAAPGAPLAPPPGLRVARVVMPRLGVDHYVERIGVVANQMQSPSDGVNAIGWYPEYATPGYGGNAVFAAHETWDRVHAPFYSLHVARDGDEVAVMLSDGSRLRYLVISNTRYDATRIPMGEIIWPSSMPSDEERVTFITCGGRFVPTGDGLGEYLDRDVVVARRV